MSVRFRRVVAGDRLLIDELIGEFHTEHGDPIDQGARRRAVDAICNGYELIPTWLIEAEGEPVGYVALAIGYTIEVGGGDCFIDELYVRSKARGRGYGKQAMAFVQRAAAELGCRRLCLEVRYSNSKAKALYSELGYYGFDRELLFKDIVKD